jgi:hypothetical protein
MTLNAEDRANRLEELEAERTLARALLDARALSDKLYAIKLVEYIVFGLVGLIMTGVIGALVALILRPIS